MTKIFCYGTLNLHEIQMYLWGETKQGAVAQLSNYELKGFSNNIFYVEKNFGETVAGKVYDLNDEQLKATDRYETSAYKREKVQIGGVEVEVYAMNNDYFSKKEGEENEEGQN